MTPYNYCKSMLPNVSRTFVLNITILKGDLYKASLCSYIPKKSKLLKKHKGSIKETANDAGCTTKIFVIK